MEKVQKILKIYDKEIGRYDIEVPRAYRSGCGDKEKFEKDNVEIEGSSSGNAMTAKRDKDNHCHY